MFTDVLKAVVLSIANVFYIYGYGCQIRMEHLFCAIFFLGHFMYHL